MTTRSTIRTALCLCAAAGLARAQQSDLLERVRDALGEAPDGIVTLTGDSSLLGDGRFTTVFDGEGRFRTTIEGDLSLASGYDGRTAWQLDWNAMPRVLELGDVDEALLEAWAISGHWARAQGSVRIEQVDPPDDDPHLRLTMSGGKLTAIVRIDGESWLPHTIAIERPSGDEIISLADYRPVGGLMVPTAVDVVTPAGPSNTMRVSGLAAAPAPEAVFEPPLERPADARFDPDAPPLLEVKRVPTGHLLVHPLVNGEDVGWFIFDTGAGSNVLSTAAAEALSIERTGRVTAQGVGGAVETGFYRVGELTLGPVTLADQAFVGIDLSFLKPYFGVDVAGIVGYDLLARCVVEFDAVAPAIAIHDPQRYQAPDGTEWERLMLPGRIPAAVARFEGHEQPFRLDTGAAGDTVAFHAPAVEEFDLLAGRRTTPGVAGGVGGTVEVREGEVASFTLGGRTFENLRARFATEGKGALADPYTAGNIGGLVLGNFKIVFDYPHRRIGFIGRDAG